MDGVAESVGEGVDVDDCDLQVDEGVALLHSLDVEVIELLLRDVDEKVGLAPVETLLDIIFQEFEADLR